MELNLKLQYQGEYSHPIVFNRDLFINKTIKVARMFYQSKCDVVVLWFTDGSIVTLESKTLPFGESEIRVNEVIDDKVTECEPPN